MSQELGANRTPFQRWFDSLLVLFRYRSPYFRGKGRIYNFARRLMKNRPLTIRYAEGWITVNEGNYIPSKILQDGAYEPEVWNALAYIAQQDEILWDIGANIGSFTLAAMSNPKIRQIHCFEPDPKTLRALEQNIHLNVASHKVVLHPFALGSITQSIDFYFGANPAINSAARDSGLGSITVQCYTVDDIINSEIAPIPTLLKIDVEDWDEDVIRSADFLLTTHPPKAIVFEAEATKVGNIVNDELTNYLLGKNYTIHHIMRPDGKIYFTPTTSNYLENYIAIHNSLDLKKIVF